jgi:hypothetical protein
MSSCGRWYAVGCALVLAACADEAANQTDAPLPRDGAVAEVSGATDLGPDAAVPDAGTPDGAVLDAAPAPDAAPDIASPDAAAPDAAIDAAGPDAAIDAAAPDAAAPDAAIDAAAPDAAAPDQGAPDAGQPDIDCMSTCNALKPPNTTVSTCSGSVCVFVCNNGTLDCNNTLNQPGDTDGCEVDLNAMKNTCATATQMTQSICGDENADVATATGLGSAWYRVQVEECSNWDHDFNVAVSIAANQGGAAYDIYVREGSCTAALDGKGACSWDCVDDDWSDDWGADDSKWIYIMVTHVSGGTCAGYTLKAHGNSYCTCP